MCAYFSVPLPIQVLLSTTQHLASPAPQTDLKQNGYCSAYTPGHRSTHHDTLPRSRERTRDESVISLHPECLGTPHTYISVEERVQHQAEQRATTYEMVDGVMMNHRESGSCPSNTTDRCAPGHRKDAPNTTAREAAPWGQRPDRREPTIPHPLLRGEPRSTTSHAHHL